MKTYDSVNEKELQIIETQEVKTTYSYDYILNKIQELEAQLTELKDLKKEADKLGLKR